MNKNQDMSKIVERMIMWHANFLIDQVILHGKDANLSERDANFLDDIGWDGWRRAQEGNGFEGLKVSFEKLKPSDVQVVDWGKHD